MKKRLLLLFVCLFFPCMIFAESSSGSSGLTISQDCYDNALEIKNTLLLSGINENNANNVYDFLTAGDSCNFFTEDMYLSFQDTIFEITEIMEPVANEYFGLDLIDLDEEQKLELLYGGGLGGPDLVTIRQIVSQSCSENDISYAYNLDDKDYPLWYGAFPDVSLEESNGGSILIYSERNPEFNIIYHTDIGEVPATKTKNVHFILSIWSDYGVDINPEDLPVLTADGYEFKGWAIDSINGEIINSEYGYGGPYGGDVNLYAVWENHEHDYSTFVSNDTGIYEKCECGELGK